MRLTKTQLSVAVALLAGNAIVLFSDPGWSWLRLPTAVALTMVLPGLAWLPPLRWLRTRRAIERIALTVGLGSLIANLGLLVAILWPGPFTLTPALVALNVTILLGLIYQSFPRWQPSHPAAIPSQPPPNKGRSQNLPEKSGTLQWPSRTVLLLLIGIVVLAAVTRLTRLGYAEFHEDELENTRLIVRVFKGEEYAIFQDSKGPIHALIPATIWYMNGWTNEGIARFPFALIALVQVLFTFELGRRLAHNRDSVGLLAAAFVAFNGYFIALARHLENRIFIVFWGILLMWLLYRYIREEAPEFLLIAALALGIGLIAHFEMLFFVALVIFWIGWKLWFQPDSRRRQWPWIGAALLFFAAVTALFYVPYFNDPDIGLVYQYLAEDRLGTSVLYNNVGNMFREDQDFSAPYHLPLLILLLAWVLGRLFAHAGRRWLAGLLGLTLLMIGVVWLPDVWLVAGLNLAFVPFALLTLAVLFLPRAAFEIKYLYLWLSAPIGAILFLTLDATNHVQLGQTAWAVLCGLALVDIWRLLTPGSREVAPHLPPRVVSLSGPGWLEAALKAGLVAVLLLIAAITFSYQYLVSNATVTTYWQVRLAAQANPNSIYNWLYGDIEGPRRIISNPRFGGWKAVGYLWDTGQLNGDFRSMNESFAVPIWYTFQTPRSCYNDPEHYWVRRNEEGWPPEAADLPERGYTLTRVVLVDDQPKLHLYEKNAPPGEPQVLDVEEYRAQFDRLATPANFAAGDEIGRPLSLNFGDKLLLRGVTMPATVEAGRLLPVTLHWEALAPMDIRYRAFVHLVGPNDSRQGQHDDDPACRLLTTEMRPGQTSSRQFRVPVAPDTPPGDYQVLVGVYHPETFERLPIWDNRAQSSPGDSLVIGAVRVE